MKIRNLCRVRHSYCAEIFKVRRGYRPPASLVAGVCKMQLPDKLIGPRHEGEADLANE